MPKIKTILVPIDVAQTQAAAAALELARDMARTHGATLVLLNVLEQVPGYVAAQLPKSFHENALSDAAARLKEIAAGHGLAKSAEIVVRDGHPSTEILEYANSIGADMIVIASHDPGLADYFLGSVAARVVRHAHCSVLVVRHAER
ncbi:MAG: universal stress protein [Alphaproteobacteria bacterium]|nr:universal stress protein [Alphaproteobacteria bacterium]